MEKRFENSLVVYSVKGGNKGSVELVLAEHPVNAIEVSSINEMGETKATPIDMAPKFRQCTSGIDELMDDIEWYDADLKEWKSVTVDESLYAEYETDLLSDNDYL